MSVEHSTRRRWFQFRLGTMFLVVTVVAVFLAYHLNWIRQRHEVIKNPHVTVGLDKVREEEIGNNRVRTITITAKAPWPLRWFGERGYVCVDLQHDATDDDLTRAKGLFPEAAVRVDPFGQQH